MIKPSTIAFALFYLGMLAVRAAFGQQVQATKTYSPNGRYYVTCTPYYGYEPSLKGVTKVYTSGNQLLYTINRNFSGLRESVNYLSLSNDGQTITHVNVFDTDEDQKNLKSVTIYRAGKLLRDFSLTEVTGCHTEEERCKLNLDNYSSIIDMSKGSHHMPKYQRVYKPGVTNEDIFICDNSIRADGDNLYIVDPNKVVRIINTKTATIQAPITFKKYYRQFKNKPATCLTAIHEFMAPYAPDPSYFPNLKNGDTTGFALARYIHKKATRSTNDFLKYKVDIITIGAYINRNGDIKIEKLEAGKGLPLDSVRQFLASQKYDMSFLPPEVDQWYFDHFFWYFRNADDAKAMQEKQKQDEERALARQRRMTQDSIDGVYIPQNMQECFTELDKLLPVITKKEFAESAGQGGIMGYHLSLGMGIRNRFGLWGGSRLLAYFESRFGNKFALHPDNLSSMIMSCYDAWLNGDKQAAEKWEAKYPVLSK